MDREQLLVLIETFKLLKSDIIVTHNNIIMGSDVNFVYFKKLELDYQLPMIAINMLDIQNQLKVTDDISNINLFNINYFNNMIYKLNTIPLLINNDGIMYDNIHNDDDIKEALSMRTYQGIKYIKRGDKFIIPIYNGLLPVVKADKIDLQIYDYNYYQFLCKFIIHKKNNINIEMYLLCRHMV